MCTVSRLLLYYFILKNKLWKQGLFRIMCQWKTLTFTYHMPNLDPKSYIGSLQ